MKILVTGATGFIGNHLVHSLVNKGHEVRCLVRQSSNRENLIWPGIELVYGDITEPESLYGIFKGINVVYHLAGIRGETEISFNMYRDVNIQGTKNIIEASSHEHIKQFIYVSTIGVLGWPDILPADEGSPYKPIGKYHITKCEAEKLVIAAFKEKGFPATIIRPVMTYGLEADGFLFNLTRLVKSGKFRFIGNGHNHLHLVYLDNLVQGLTSIAGHSNTNGQIYIIADEMPITITRLVTVIAQSLNVDVPRKHIPVRIARLAGFGFEIIYKILRRQKEPFITRGRVDLISKNRSYNISKARRELDYNSLINTEYGVKQSVEYFVGNGLV